MSMDFKRKLPIPKEIKEQYPVTEELAKIKAQRDADIKAVFTGELDKFLLIIGPCSADNEEAVLDYMGRLKKVADEVSDKIIVIPRVYTNKPRTTGEGYKGMLHQPNPDEKPDMLKGILAIRDLHMRALADYGFTCADEMLYPENYRYLSDLLGYVAIGARSVENQQHRLVASGISIPVGMKNPTSGDLTVMMNSINAAQNSHTYLYRGWRLQARVMKPPTQYFAVIWILAAEIYQTTTMKISLIFASFTRNTDLKILQLLLTLTTRIHLRSISSKSVFRRMLSIAVTTTTISSIL